MRDFVLGHDDCVSVAVQELVVVVPDPHQVAHDLVAVGMRAPRLDRLATGP